MSRPKRFSQFVDKKMRHAKKQLDTVNRVLQKEGMNTQNHTEEEDPFIFIKNPGTPLSFDGIRMYHIGGKIAWRIQKEEDTHPYGDAYSLDVEGMFHDLVSDEHMDEEKAGKEVMEGIVKEIRSFFDKSSEAEKEERSAEFDQAGDPLGKTMIRGQGNAFSNQVTSTNPRNSYGSPS